MESKEAKELVDSFCRNGTKEYVSPEIQGDLLKWLTTIENIPRKVKPPDKAWIAQAIHYFVIGFQASPLPNHILNLIGACVDRAYTEATCGTKEENEKLA